MNWLGVVRGLVCAGLVLGGVAFGLTSGAVATSSVASAQTPSSIVVEGNRRIEASTIRSYFHAGRNGRLSPAEINAGLKALYATGLFKEVTPLHQRGHLVIRIVENPVINQVAFEGNKKIKDNQLKTEIQSRARGTFSLPMVQADTQRIIELYRHYGRYDVKVVPEYINLPNNRVNLVFKITEGAKTGVAEIRFVGNHAFSSYRLKDVIKTTASNFLSFLQTSDIYDPDRVEADRDLLRRFYLDRGYADVRILSANAVYDPSQKGFIITYVIDEGARYRFGKVDIQSTMRNVNPDVLRSQLETHSGDVYSAKAVQKSVEDMTIEAAKRGYAFATVHPRAERNYKTHRINLVYVIEEGPRVYIERIDIHGNNHTRDYVIRREFDIAEGDAYNKALVDRAERRLKNLDYFKSVKITEEPGSAPDRVVLDVNVVEKPTGNFSVAGGYSTSAGFIGEASVSERNILGEGYYGKISIQLGQYVRGGEVTFVNPYFLGYRLAAGIDLFSKQQLATNYISYESRNTGGTLRLGFAMTENLTFQVHYSAYDQTLTLPSQYTDCSFASYAAQVPTASCYKNGEASLPVKLALRNGGRLTSLIGYKLTYNSLDNNKNPTSGLFAQLNQDFAGVGGDVNFLRTTAEARYYHELVGDLVGVLRVQGGNILGWGGKGLTMLDLFQMGPNLVRGFEPSGIGPRDLTPGTTNDAIGGSLYWGASAEVQMPVYFLPREINIKMAAFADAGSLWDYQGPVSDPATHEILKCGGNTTDTRTVGGACFGDSMAIRSSVGLGLIWDSPFGPLRFDYAFPITKAPYDRTQEFRFSGGTTF